ncbi:N-acetylneuraminate synthase [Thermoanaerobacterium thermosaccharolyticum]|uniref:N-acetylneuraminate synthase n=1 Tax=Thermoanaerobacterium thermosaccharolyticum TaxID=1517 RepID=A0A223HWL1_THETR|nr:N-acetylneuraminate synthase [Thermoanaerobacterium thermosaccharolyticum]AST56848.1 N-acetylneuraminate synthase [Thermoanaerobacterium thermosaccharolyticum]
MPRRVFIIAEAGVNHNGDIENAKKLIYVAKKSGADAVKFQTFKSEKVISKFAQKAEYQKETTGESDTQLDMVKKLELPYKDFKELKKYCDEVEINFMSTPFDLDSIEFLNELNIDVFKIPSGEITNLPYLIKIAQTNKPIIMSTGMSTLDEIEAAINILRQNGSGEITLLHCTTEYPAPYKDVNLRAMKTLRERFKVNVGYSDHTKGIEIPIAAVAMGAAVIEKHFTLDRNMEGPDHKASLEPDELKAMVQAIRNVESALGDGIKRPTESEIKNITIARKSIIAKRDIKKGEIFTEENITVKRPGNGISPMKWFEVLGKTAVRDFKEDELIEL